MYDKLGDFMKKCVVICNPHSGKKKKDVYISKFKEILNEYSYDVQVLFTSYQGHAKKIIFNLDDDVDLVVSFGGDGTFNEVVNGNLKRNKKLLLTHIPFGTTNDLGAMFGMVKNPVQNLKLVLDGTIKDIDICTINDVPFVYVAGLGKFTNVAYDTPRSLKKNFGYLAYMLNAIKSFNRKTSLFEMTLTANGEEYTGLYSFILICNASRMGGLEILQDVKMNDDKFEVLVSNISSKKDIIKSLYYVKTSDITKVPGFYFFKTNYLKIKLKERPKKRFCIDGEELNDRSKEYEIKIVKGIKMLLPKKEIDKIFI